MNINTILANEEGISVVACMPAMADVISGAVAKPERYPESAMQSVDAWVAWFQASPASATLRTVLDDLGVTDVTSGQAIWHEFGYLLPGTKPSCGPCQFEYAHLLGAGADGGCITLVCSVPGHNGFALAVGANQDGTRLLLWPENIGLGMRADSPPTSRCGW